MRRGAVPVLLLLLAWLPVAAPGAVEDLGPPEPGRFQAALVTYGPGPVYWQRFGHNALWLLEPGLELDHVFNFGFFDFEQENFLLRFVQGRMLYFAAQLPAQRDFRFYAGERREIRVQVLDLDATAYRRLRNHLMHAVRPEVRDYLYDYYLDNCSTRIRDALDVALGGALQAQFDRQPALQTFRAHTRRSTADAFWYYLGLEAALGMPVDRPISRWDEMFLPDVLADSIAEVSRLGTQGLEPLVRTDELLAGGGLVAVPERPPEVWSRYLAASALLVALGLLAVRFAPPVVVDGLVGGWLLIAGSLGWLMLLVWGFTDHAAANPNLNLLLLNPLAVLGLLPGLRRPVAAVLALCSLLSLALNLAPELQYSRDVFAVAGILNLACALRLWCVPELATRASGPVGR